MTDSGGESRLPWYRNPWVWGVIAGLVFVPAVRPLTRKVPDAPPIVAPLPAFQLETLSGAPLGSEDLRGGVYVLTVGTSACSSTCSEVFARGERLADRFETFNRDVRVVALDYGSGRRPVRRGSGERGHAEPPEVEPEPLPAGHDLSSAAAELSDDLPHWLVLHGSEAAIVELVDLALRPLLEGAVSPGLESFAHQARMFLIDPDGKIRGNYGSDEVGLDEVYHRAQHVLRDYRTAHRWDR